MTDSSRIELPGGWYFKLRVGEKTYELHSPDGHRRPDLWWAHDALVFASAIYFADIDPFPPAAQAGEPVTLPYTNHEGRHAERTITPTGRMLFTSNQWHPKPQWLVEAHDHVSGTVRLFALSGFGAQVGGTAIAVEEVGRSAMPTRLEAYADQAASGATFLEQLQRFASMCERSLSLEDGPMIAAKFRDAAFVISGMEKRYADRLADRQATKLRDDAAPASGGQEEVKEFRRFMDDYACACIALGKNDRDTGFEADKAREALDAAALRLASASLERDRVLEEAATMVERMFTHRNEAGSEIAARIRALKADTKTTTGAVEATLPCDVWLPPATRIAKGCALSTLTKALEQRAKGDGWAHEMSEASLAKMASEIETTPGPVEDGWQPIETAKQASSPEVILEIEGKGRRPFEMIAHWAQDLSGEEQPPFRGWFFNTGYGFSQVPGKPRRWRPLPPAPTQARQQDGEQAEGGV